MFLDETGITTNLLRRYGRAPRGARVHDHAPCGRWQTSTFLAAVRVTGLTAPGVFDGAIDGESFRAYIEQILVPTLHPERSQDQRLRTYVINAMPDLESRTLADRFFTVGADYARSDSAIAILIAALQEALGTWEAHTSDGEAAP